MTTKYRISFPVSCCTLTASLSFIVLGFGFGFPSPIAEEVTRSDLLDYYQFAVFSGVFYLTAAISGLLAMPLMYPLGRRNVLRIGAVLSGTGYVMLGLTRIPQVLILARAVNGFGSGISIPVSVIYISELAHKDTRGTHLCFIRSGIPLGIIVTYLCGSRLNYDMLTLIGAGLSIMQTILLLFVPYTPTYLLSRNLKDSALSTMEQIRSKDYDSVNEVNEISAILKEDNSNYLDKLVLLLKPWNLKAFFIVSTTIITQQASGINLFASYNSEILRDSTWDANLLGLVFPLGQILGSLVSISCIDKLGRRVLLNISLCGIILSLLLMGIYLLFKDQICHETEDSTLTLVCSSQYITICPLVVISLLGFTFSLGIGPIAFVLLGELIPTNLKHMISGIGTFILFITSFILITLYPIITKHLPRYYILFGLVIFNIVMCLILAVFTPETKGRSVAELEMLFKENTIFCCTSIFKKKVVKEFLQKMKKYDPIYICT